MKVSIISIPIIVLLMVVAACNSNRIYEAHNSDFPEYRWYKDVPIDFTVTIEDTVSEHTLSLALRHVYGYQFQTMKVYLDITSPSGKPATKGYDLQVMGGKDAYLSDCSGDICDLEVLVEEHVRFKELGEWKFVIFCDMDRPYVPNVMEFGLIIDKYPEEE